MSDEFITDLTELLATDPDDVLPIVDDPGGTPITKKVKVSTLVGAAGLSDHTHEVPGSGATGGGGTVKPALLILPQQLAPVPTVEGEVWWDTDSDMFVVGDGTAQKYIVPLGGNPVQQNFGDSISQGAASTGARSNHVHGMPANPVTAHEAAADPHADYVRQSPGADQPIQPTVDAVPLILKGNAAQTDNLQEWQNSAGAMQAGISSAGYLTIRGGGQAIEKYGNDAVEAAQYFRKSRNATLGAHTIVQNNDALISLWAFGSDGSAFVPAAYFLAQIDGVPGASDMPGRIIFGTTADGGSFPVERLRIDSAGRITIGDGSHIVLGSSSGTKIGTATTQRLGFWNAAPVVRPTGWGVPTGTPTRTTFATSSVTLPQLAERVKALIDDLTAEGVDRRMTDLPVSIELLMAKLDEQSVKIGRLELRDAALVALATRQAARIAELEAVEAVEPAEPEA